MLDGNGDADGAWASLDALAGGRKRAHQGGFAASVGQLIWDSKVSYWARNAGHVGGRRRWEPPAPLLREGGAGHAMPAVGGVPAGGEEPPAGWVGLIACPYP